MNSPPWTMPNGKHRGKPIEQIPVGYLRWMVGARHGEAERARAELQRRGSVLPTIEISGHAIDRASLYLRRTWHETRGEKEGLHAWLVRKATEALAKGERRTPTRIEYDGISFRFEMDCEWPVLKTVLPGSARHHQEVKDG